MGSDANPPLPALANFPTFKWTEYILRAINRAQYHLIDRLKAKDRFHLRTRKTTMGRIKMLFKAVFLIPPDCLIFIGKDDKISHPIQKTLRKRLWPKNPLFDQFLCRIDFGNPVIFFLQCITHFCQLIFFYMQKKITTGTRRGKKCAFAVALEAL